MLSYKDLKFPEPTKDRPYVIVNMVMTLDGKVRSGKFWPLSSDVDYGLMKQLRSYADALLIGGATARKWLDKIVDIPVYVVSKSGKVPKTKNSKIITGTVNFQKLFKTFREQGVKILLVEGGPDINWQLFKDNLVDELFLTIAPKILGGRDYKSIIDGKQFTLPRRGRLISVYKHDSELFLRYNFNHG